MAPVMRWEMEIQAEELVVRSPEGQEEPMMGQQEQTDNEPQAARTETMESPMIIEPGHTPVETGEVQSPGMLQSLMTMGQQRNTPIESQAVRSPSTQQPSPMIQQRSTPTEAQAVQSPPPILQQGNMPISTANRQPLLSQRGQINYRPQSVQSPTTQQPPPTAQQGHANTAPQAVQIPLAGSVAYNSVDSSLAPAPPTKRRKMASANHPTLKTMVPIIEQHVNSCGGMRALANNIERQRIIMLQQACRNDDYFYVALHQMFCLWSLDPDLVARLAMPKGGSILSASFTIIGQLLMENSTISDVHTRFFSMFPNHLSEFMYRSDQYSLTVNNVSIFLAKLSLEWQQYVPECRQRGCPPLVDELVNRFGLLSPILQHIIFTATRRNIGFPDEYSAQMEQLFNHDQELHRQMAARVNTAYPPTEREIQERNQWQAEQYAHVRAAQLRRVEEGCRMEMTQMPSNAPHPMEPNMPTCVQSPSNMPSAAQAGQPRPIQTNVVPSKVLIASPQSATLPSHRHAWALQVPSSHHTPSGSVPERSSRSSMPSPQGRSSRAFQLSPTLLRPIRRAPASSQTQNTPHRQGQVNHIVRSASQNASRNASRNASLSRFPGAGTAGSSPVLTAPARHSTVYTNIAPALASMPAGQGLPLPQQHVSRVSLMPPVGCNPPYQLPQPDRSALLQAHLRSPILLLTDADLVLVTNQTAHRYYQAVQDFAVDPTTLLDSPWITVLSFTVSKSIFHNIAKDKLTDPAMPLLREVLQGSLQYRVRCSRVDKGTQMEPSDFIVSDTNWPPTIFMEMNDSVLVIRGRSGYGRGQPVDITPHIFDRGPGKENTLTIAVLEASGSGNGMPYSIAIEVVEVFLHQQIVDMCLKRQRITAKDVIEDITAKLSNRTIYEDDDVALVSANLAIDLTDPFTSRIFTIPVRGVRCRHRECFDLETFLLSRSNKPQIACMPDVWKCPLCGGDATPRSLRVDDFLVSVRENLEKHGHLEVKAILVAKDGSWTAKPEAILR